MIQLLYAGWREEDEDDIMEKADRVLGEPKHSMLHGSQSYLHITDTALYSMYQESAT